MKTQDYSFAHVANYFEYVAAVNPYALGYLVMKARAILYYRLSGGKIPL